jgi:hypothetical protein
MQIRGFRDIAGLRARIAAYDWAKYRQLFTLKLVTTLRQGYSLDSFRHDAVAGLTVAILALPLSMAIAIGAGAPPGNGLVTAVVAGFLISALGGSRYQIGGRCDTPLVAALAGIPDRRGCSVGSRLPVRSRHRDDWFALCWYS